MKIKVGDELLIRYGYNDVNVRILRISHKSIKFLPDDLLKFRGEPWELEPAEFKTRIRDKQQKPRQESLEEMEL